jgi:FMN reductase
VNRPDPSLPAGGRARPLILGVGGTTRVGSTTERALSVALRAAATEGADTVLITAADLVLPMYTTDPAARTPAAKRLVDLYRSCHGLVIASPAYHGSLSGLVKNALDYAEDLRMDERAYFDGIAVGVIACAGGWQAAVQTMGVLREIAHALRGWPTPLGAALNTSMRLFDDAGECLDLSSKFQLESVGRQVVQFAAMRRGYAGRAAPLAAG